MAPSTAHRAAGTGLVLVGTAVLTGWGLHSQFGDTSFASVRSAISTQPASHLLATVVLTVLSFLALAMYDLFGAIAVAPRRVSVGVALLAGATGNAISNTWGFHALTGSAVRARIYLRFGLTRVEVARIVSLSWLALGLGFLTMLAAAELIQAVVGVHPMKSLLTALAIAAGLMLFIAWLTGGTRQLTIFGFKQPMPSARMALVQMGTGAVESAAAIGALYVLLPSDLAPPFSLFAVGCTAAVALGLVVHAPGGIGIFEASVTAMLSGAGRADLLAALLLYRAIYNILPFLLSVAALGLLSCRRRPALNSKAGTG